MYCDMKNRSSEKTYFGKEIDGQLAMIFRRSLIIDLCIFVLTLPLYGADYRIILGLLLGTAAMAANMLLLAYSVIHSVDRGSEKRAKRYMFTFYLIRLTVMGAALALGFSSSHINSVCTFMPLLYPKLIYTLSGVRDHLSFVKKSKFGGSSDNTKR